MSAIATSAKFLHFGALLDKFFSNYIIQSNYLNSNNYLVDQSIEIPVKFCNFHTVRAVSNLFLPDFLSVVAITAFDWLPCCCA